MGRKSSIVDLSNFGHDMPVLRCRRWVQANRYAERMTTARVASMFRCSLALSHQVNSGPMTPFELERGDDAKC
jgi:hypothetical protein